MGTGKRRSSAQRARDRRRISALYMQRRLQVDIADEVGVSQATVSRDLKALQCEWLESALIDFNSAKARELARIDYLELEYWDAWQRSCEDAETLVKDGTPEKVEKLKRTSKGQAGDPRFLQGVQWCIEKRCKILGIEAPTKLDVTTGGEKIKAYTVLAHPDMWPGKDSDSESES